MKSIFLVLMTVGTGVVGSGLGFLSQLNVGNVTGFSGGVINGATITLCYNIETANKKGLFDKKPGNLVVNETQPNLKNQLQQQTSDSNINIDNISCKDVLENSSL